MRPPTKRPGHRYRICKKCKLEYNVPIDYDYGKNYICFKCAGKEKQPNERTPRTPAQKRINAVNSS